MKAILDIEAKDEFAILTMIEAITRLNERYLRDNPDTPELYASGVVYEREGSPELWFDIPNILDRGADDCEGLAGWRAAELRVAGFDADPVLKRFTRPNGSTLYHCITEVHLPNGRHVLDDPSARLGMFDRSGGQVTGLPETEQAARFWKPLPARTATAPRADNTQRPIEVVRLATFQPDKSGHVRVRPEPKHPELRAAIANLAFDSLRELDARLEEELAAGFPGGHEAAHPQSLAAPARPSLTGGLPPGLRRATIVRSSS